MAAIRCGDRRDVVEGLGRQRLVAGERRLRLLERAVDARGGSRAHFLGHQPDRRDALRKGVLDLTA